MRNIADYTVAVAVDVEVPDELPLPVLVGVEVAEPDEVAEGVVEDVADALNVPDAVSDPEMDCVLEGVVEAVEVLDALGVDVLVPDEEAEDVLVAVDVAVGELEVSSATSCVPISVSSVIVY